MDIGRLRWKSIIIPIHFTITYIWNNNSKDSELSNGVVRYDTYVGIWAEQVVEVLWIWLFWILVNLDNVMYSNKVSFFTAYEFDKWQQIFQKIRCSPSMMEQPAWDLPETSGEPAAMDSADQISGISIPKLILYRTGNTASFVFFAKQLPDCSIIDGPQVH
jgi:hypothetical protein